VRFLNPSVESLFYDFLCHTYSIEFNMRRGRGHLWEREHIWQNVNLSKRKRN
jgi:hypothetical protein